MELLFSADAWISFFTLAALEIVLGIDNLVFISVVSERLPRAQQATAQKVGLALAVFMRLGLLLSISWLIGLKEPLFSLMGRSFSVRDLILVTGGLFLLAKGTTEIHGAVEGDDVGHSGNGRPAAKFAGVIAQIVFLDIIFSLDSVITAVGMAEHVPIMAAAIVVAVIVMLFAVVPLSKFIAEHATVKILALSFLLLVGVTLIADGFGMHVPRGYLYFAIAYSVGVEALNLVARRKRKGATQQPHGS